MSFALATYNVRDLFDDAPPYRIGGLHEAALTPAARAARAPQLYRAKLAAIAPTVRRLDADVIAFQEISGARVLDDLRATLAPRQGAPASGYGPALCASPDERGIACGLLTRLPVLEVREHHAQSLPFPAFTAADPRPFGAQLRTHRAVLEARLALPGGCSLTVFVVHLKSALPIPLVGRDGRPVGFANHRDRAEGAARALVTRIAEALFVRALVDARLDAEPDGLVAVAGDFNDVDGSVAVRAVTGEPALELVEAAAGVRRGLYACARAVPAEARFSLLFRSSTQQVDHVLASAALWERFRSARFLNETLRDDVAAFEQGGLASDHAPLVAEFA